MQIEKIKERITKRLIEINKEIQSLSNQINNLTETKIDLSNYATIRQKYLEKYRKNSKVKAFIPVSKTKLKKFILEEQKKELKNKIQKLTKEKRELTHLQEQLSKEGNDLYPNKSFLAAYIIETQTSSEIIDTIISFCRRIPLDNEEVMAQIERNIANVFDSTNQIKKNTTIETVNWLFSKLFSFFPESQAMTTKAIAIKKELKKRYESKEVKREDLTNVKDALNTLTKYLKNGQIIATYPDLQEFKSLLSIAEVSEEQKQNLISEMEKRIKKEQIVKEDHNLLKKYLTKDEFEYLKKANELSKKSSDELHQMIKEEIHQIILLCRYLKLAPTQNTFHESYDSIARHFDSIKIIINTITSPKVEENYFYLIDEFNKPYILKSILAEDVTNYDSIYFFLRSIRNLLSMSTIATTKDNIEIRSINNGKYTIYFKISGNDLIIIDIKGVTLDKENLIISKNIQKQIENIETKKQDPQFRQIHATYEKIISSTLDLDKTKPKTLQKERK